MSCRHARVFVGDRHDRFRADSSWSSQITATIEVIERLTPRLKDLGIRLAIETHADLTCDELLAVLDRLDPAIAGVTLDTGNLVMRLDDPVDAARRCAPTSSPPTSKTRSWRSPAGLCWQARPVGSGILPLPDILAALIHQNPAITLSIELHPRTYDLPIYDRKWLAFFPACGPNHWPRSSGWPRWPKSALPTARCRSPEAVESIPWASRDLDWLARSLGFLRSVVPTLAGI